MPVLTVKNLIIQDTQIMDPSGLSNTRLYIPAGTTKTLTVDGQILERLAPQLKALETASTPVISYSVADDTATDPRAELKEGVTVVREFIQTISTANVAALAGAAANFALTGFPAKSFTIASAIELVTPFTGTAITGLTASIGDAGDTDELCVVQEVLSAAVANTILTGSGALTALWTYEATYAPVVRFSATGGNLSAMLTGKCVAHIYYATVVPSKGI